MFRELWLQDLRKVSTPPFVLSVPFTFVKGHLTTAKYRHKYMMGKKNSVVTFGLRPLNNPSAFTL